jgi:hypothetical protein
MFLPTENLGLLDRVQNDEMRDQKRELYSCVTLLAGYGLRSRIHQVLSEGAASRLNPSTVSRSYYFFTILCDQGEGLLGPNQTRHPTQFPLRLAKSLREAANSVAKEQGVSLNHFIAIAVAEKISRTESQLESSLDGAKAKSIDFEEECAVGLGQGGQIIQKS